MSCLRTKITTPDPDSAPLRRSGLFLRRLLPHGPWRPAFRRSDADRDRHRHRTRPDTLARCVGVAILVLSAGHDRVAAATLPGVTVQALAVDPTNAQIVYAGTTFGVYKTVDGGANWLSTIIEISPHETLPVQIRHLRQRSIIANPV